ncbi:sugar-transfer associated ATP-grasp domain-containing protein [Bacillus alkalisoli]|uniref:sugar-transfer associated ATP-grasp domain-containing protein n=1 Tax=Bacillus alkalisoli TaxID=2011008 RepID=UPI000C24B5E3|nr:sugar-transfer associated ATP-grasp domain-containing protein [Bacillus alkalisoli]
MRKAFKRLRRFINEDSINIYLKLYYKWQIRFKFLTDTDSIDFNLVKDIKEHWRKFNIKGSTNWHKWYSSRNGIKDVRYIPEDIFYCNIEPFYNRVNFIQAYSDKAFHNVWFSNINRPVTIAKNISGTCFDDEFNVLSQNDVIDRCLNEETIVIKPTIESGGGRDICFINLNTVTNKRKEVLKVIKNFKKDYIIQGVIKQHKDLSSINQESVNTIRTMSFLYQGKVHILSSVLRMGVNGAKVDNQAAGGISSGISNSGKLSRYAFDKYGNSLEEHPQGFVFNNFIVPSYSDVIEIIKKEHLKLGHFKIISWDFAIDKDGIPVLIEYNLRFQEMNFHQINNGPLFGELTNDVLEDVFGRR